MFLDEFTFQTHYYKWKFDVGTVVLILLMKLHAHVGDQCSLDAFMFLDVKVNIIITIYRKSLSML